MENWFGELSSWHFVGIGNTRQFGACPPNLGGVPLLFSVLPAIPRPHHATTSAGAVRASRRSAEFILVTVNNRLGVKAIIPCLPNDTIVGLKKLVGAQIGSRIDAIILKGKVKGP